jgi:hypothetical protein
MLKLMYRDATQTVVWEMHKTIFGDTTPTKKQAKHGTGGQKMANEKKMYVIQADDGMFFCGLKYWDKQLRKAKIYHSLHYAMDVVSVVMGNERFEVE